MIALILALVDDFCFWTVNLFLLYRIRHLMHAILKG